MKGRKGIRMKKQGGREMERESKEERERGGGGGGGRRKHRTVYLIRAFKHTLRGWA